jgi:hypothetical protein
VAGLGLMLTMGLASDLSCQSVTGEREWRNRRELNGYTFTPSVNVGSPFVTTYVRNATGVGLAIALRVPLLGLIGDTIRTLQGDMVFGILEFEYQQAIGNRLALRLGGSGVARIGTDEQSIVAQGISSVYGLRGGATVKLLQNEEFLLSAVAEAASNELIIIAPLNFVRKVVNEGFEPGGDNGLLQEGSNLRLSGGLRMAYSPSKWFGFTAIGELGSGDPFRDIDSRETTVRLGGTAGVDFGAGTRWPIGLLLSFRYDSFNEQGEDLFDNSWIGGWRLSYTGRADFNIGLETTLARSNLRDSDDSVDTSLYRFTLRYYF